MTAQDLRQTINQRFSLSDIRTLCFDLSIEYEDLGGGPKSDIITALITYCKQNNRLSDLQSYLQKARSFVDWAPLFTGLTNIAANQPAPSESANTQVAGDVYGLVSGNQGHIVQNFNYGPEPKSDNQAPKDFAKVKKLMPDLLAAMKKDLEESPLFRELILKKKGWIYNSGGKPYIAYTFEEHEDLEEKIHILENCGFVRDVTFNNTARYRLTEEFADLLMADK